MVAILSFSHEGIGRVLQANWMRVLAGSLFLAISAQISIPCWPVPMTMQPYALIVLGFMLSPRLACGVVIVYFAEALVGLPVLQGFSSGWGSFSGTTAGYLVGFLPMIAIISVFSERSQALSKQFLLSLYGQGALYLCGVLWLSLHMGLESAMAYGLLPFLVKIPLSILLALYTVRLLRK